MGTHVNTMTEEILIPNAFLFENEAAFQDRLSRARYHRTDHDDTSIFRNNGANVVFGEEALRSGKPSQITGPDKYRVGVLDNMVIAALLKLVPDGYRNIVVACAHTSNAIPYIDKMSDALKQIREVIRDDGKTVRYSIRAFMPWDEPAGGLLRFFTRNEGAYSEKDIRPGDTVIIVDIGGRISSMYPAKVKSGMKVEILWQQGTPFPFGIQNITQTLEQELRHQYRDIFSTKSIPHSILTESLTAITIDDEGFPRHWARVRGDMIDVTQSVENAIGPMITQIQNVYVNDLNTGLNASHIVVTGGGGGLLFNILKQDILQHNYVYLADDADTIHFANLRGGEYAASVWAEQNFEKLYRVIDGKRVAPLMLIIDPGNTGIKAKLMGVKNGRAT